MYMVLFTRQVALNLMGKSNDPLIMTGDAMDEDKLLQRLAKEENKALRDFFMVNKLFLNTYFGDFESSAKHALKNGDRLQKDAPGSIYVRIETYHRALSLLIMARETKQRKLKRAAKRVMRQINSWVAQGDPNAIHIKILLDAEMAALKGQKQEAEAKFKDSVIFAARGGFVHDAAFASERYAIFLLDDLNDRDEAAYRMKEACKYYQEWGAEGKLKSLQETYGDLLNR